MTVVFLDAAESEAAEATEYYEQIDPDLAERFRLEIEPLLVALGANPDLHAPRRDGFRRINFDGLPYCLAYVLRADAVTIVGVAHAARRPNYFRHRLP